MRHVKIVCTLGPASDSPEILRQMIVAGMDVARLNFSHGSHEEHGRRIQLVRRLAVETGRRVAVLLDTKGPEVRVGALRGGRAYLAEGSQIVLTAERIEGDSFHIPVNYKELVRALRPGQKVLIDDGLMVLEVLKPYGTERPAVFCRVLVGGELLAHKGVNIPGARLDLPAVSDQDINDITFGVELGVDAVAASFVRSASDLQELQGLLKKLDTDLPVFAKIESQEGVENFEEILELADGVMVARGDLGVEIPVEEVPLVQKMIIRRCNEAGKPVITATQMLESMVHSARPTRAEASDVANAVLDGTDAVMLSGETAAGRYPLQSVQTMVRLVERAESNLAYQQSPLIESVSRLTTTDAISYATCSIAKNLGARAIITPTTSGSTPCRVARYRPATPVIAASADERVLRRLCLVWGVWPLLVRKAEATDEVIRIAEETAQQAGLVTQGDLVLITAGIPVGVPGTTNMLKVHIIGEE